MHALISSTLPRFQIHWMIGWGMRLFVMCCLSLALGARGAELGLSVTSAGEVQHRDVVFRGIGVNYYDAFARTLGEPARTNYDAGFAALAARRIPFARFSMGGYWPADWKLYQTNAAEYFARLDGVIRSAEHHGIGLIPSLFWHASTVPDLVREPVRAWGATNSATHEFMRRYTRQVVTRYRRSPAIWGWEFGNEYNLVADLPNASQHRPPVVPSLGTPDSRSVQDELTHDMIRTAFRSFAEEVRRHDPDRMIFTGNAFPRPSAWHQAKEKSWRRDTPAQFAEVLASDNPSPVNSLSVRAYDLTNDLGRLSQAMAVARQYRKPLFVGEFGAPGFANAETRSRFETIIDCLETNQVALASLWVFDFEGQSKDWNVSPSNDRGWQLEAIQRANDRINARR